MRVGVGLARALGVKVPRVSIPRARGIPNRTESEYAGMLEVKKRAGKVRHYGFEEITLKLGFDCRYTPDWFVVLEDGTMEFHETKGDFAYEDSLVKLRIAAKAFPWFRFYLCRKRKTGWTVKLVQAA